MGSMNKLKHNQKVISFLIPHDTKIEYFDIFNLFKLFSFKEDLDILKKIFITLIQTKLFRKI